MNTRTRRMKPRGAVKHDRWGSPEKNMGAESEIEGGLAG